MAKITAYKCDVCGRISEDVPPFAYEENESDIYGPGFTIYQRSAKEYTSELCACSWSCIITAINVWPTGKQSTALEPEEKQAVLEGVQTA